MRTKLFCIEGWTNRTRKVISGVMCGTLLALGTPLMWILGQVVNRYDTTTNSSMMTIGASLIVIASLLTYLGCFILKASYSVEEEPHIITIIVLIGLVSAFGVCGYFLGAFDASSSMFGNAQLIYASTIMSVSAYGFAVLFIAAKLDDTN